MPTNKELLDAATFHRRRLVGAMFAGSAERPPAGALRPVAGGLILASAAVAGLVVARYLGAPL